MNTQYQHVDTAVNDKLLSNSNLGGLRVGDVWEKRMDSSSPPACWIEQYTITKITETREVWGVYKATTDFYEFGGADME